MIIAKDGGLEFFSHITSAGPAFSPDRGEALVFGSRRDIGSAAKAVSALIHEDVYMIVLDRDGDEEWWRVDPQGVVHMPPRVGNPFVHVVGGSL